MKICRIWLDDIREPSASLLADKDNFFALCKKVSEARKAISLMERILGPYHVKFVFYLDHDLGEKETGYDFAKWFVEWNYDKQYAMEFYLLTANPVGRGNIRQLLTHYGYEEFLFPI